MGMAVQIRCSKCDRLCEPADRYCPSCHEPLTLVQLDDNPPIEGIEKEFWVGFIGKNADKYLNVFQQKPNGKWFRNFHLPAFLITTEWLVYRKMYWQALVAWLFSTLLLFGMAMLCRVVSYQQIFAVLVIFMLLVIAGRAVFAFFAHNVYKNHCLRHLRRNPGVTINGGTTTIGAILCYVVSQIISNVIIEPILTALIYMR